MARGASAEAACQHIPPVLLLSRVPGLLDRGAGPRRRSAPRSSTPPGAGEVQVRALHSGISRGTEMLVFRGEVPASEFERMRAPFQEGDFPAPVKYGYASVGVVEQGPEALLGRAVFCLYPHQTRYVVPADAVHPLPEGLPPARAVLAANMETAVNALWDAAPRVGDRIAVVGARRGRPAGRLARRRACRAARSSWSTCSPRAARWREALGVAFAEPGSRDARCRPGGACQRQCRRPGHRAAAGRLRGHGARAELVRPARRARCRWARPSIRGASRSRARRSARWPRRSARAGAIGAGLALALVAAARSGARRADHRQRALRRTARGAGRLAAGAPDTLCQRIDYP